jgi:hypothetical protein
VVARAISRSAGCLELWKNNWCSVLDLVGIDCGYERLQHDAILVVAGFVAGLI